MINFIFEKHLNLVQQEKNRFYNINSLALQIKLLFKPVDFLKITLVYIILLRKHIHFCFLKFNDRTDVHF